jgi:hypothetical protein
MDDEPLDIEGYPVTRRMLKRVPNLPEILRAIREFEEGRPITSRCPTCGNLLQVETFDFETSRTRWVVCGKGCTSYHELWTAPKEQP